MQNQVTEEDRLRCFVDSKYSPQRTIRHLELKRTQKHMLYSRCMDLAGCLICRIDRYCQDSASSNPLAFFLFFFYELFHFIMYQLVMRV